MVEHPEFESICEDTAAFSFWDIAVWKAENEKWLLDGTYEKRMQKIMNQARKRETAKRETAE